MMNKEKMLVMLEEIDFESPTIRIGLHTPENVASLAQHMKDHGQLQNIVVGPAVNGKRRVFAGLGRCKAAKHLNWKAIDAYELTPEEIAKYDQPGNGGFYESVQREPASPQYISIALTLTLLKITRDNPITSEVVKTIKDCFPVPGMRARFGKELCPLKIGDETKYYFSTPRESCRTILGIYDAQMVLRLKDYADELKDLHEKKQVPSTLAISERLKKILRQGNYLSSGNISDGTD